MMESIFGMGQWMRVRCVWCRYEGVGWMSCFAVERGSWLPITNCGSYVLAEPWVRVGLAYGFGITRLHRTGDLGLQAGKIANH